MKSSSVQEACEDQVSDISSQAASNNNEASNTSPRPKLALDLSLTVTRRRRHDGRVEHHRQQQRRRAGHARADEGVHLQLLPEEVLQLAGAGRAPERAPSGAHAGPARRAPARGLPLRLRRRGLPPALRLPGLYPIGIQAHASAHPGAIAAQAERQQQQQEDAAVHAATPARARALLGPMPFLVGGDEEVSFGWPGSFRPPPPGAGALPLFHSGNNFAAAAAASWCKPTRSPT
ncbi:zinc finger protein 4-like [Hordeum vulgare]|nr:zinc finger protein 4-like [Hordeum vulgare]